MSLEKGGGLSRQMNPGVFGDTVVPTQMNSYEPLPLFEQSLAQSGPSFEEINDKIDKNRYEIERWAKSINLRLEKTTLKAQQVDDKLNQIFKDLNDKVSQILSKIKERQMNEIKGEALIERHNQIVQNFDLRLSQAQRVIENQSLQLAKQQELIDDSRRQIEKLKRL